MHTIVEINICRMDKILLFSRNQTVKISCPNDYSFTPAQMVLSSDKKVLLLNETIYSVTQSKSIERILL